MNTMNDFTDLLSFEEMDFFPNLDLCLPQYDDGTGLNDDVFQITTKENEDFSTGEILQELDLGGNYNFHYFSFQSFNFICFEI